MNKSKIEWCDYTWNPITGCLHGCDYCYARRQTNRFKGELYPNKVYAIENCSLKLYKSTGHGFYENHDIEKPVKNKEGRIVPYPFGFKPTFHRYRLDEPKKLKRSSRIFVVSMGDLFGEWVPDEWIEEVFKACEAAPQHTYMFLTKNPVRYAELCHKGILRDKENFWYGTTRTTSFTSSFVKPKGDNTKYSTFFSIEPLQKAWEVNPYGWFDSTQWVIVGAQTGTGAKPPKPEWVQSIIDQCRAAGVPIFLKNNLNWPEKIQEFPEGI